jgi:hypothetical protein
MPLDGAGAPIVGYHWVGLVSVVFTLASVLLAGRLRPAQTATPSAVEPVLESIPLRVPGNRSGAVRV